VIDELHKQLQHLEQQLFSVMSTMERSAEDALHVERAIKSRSEPFDAKRRMPQQQQQQNSQLRQDTSPSRHASSNGSAFVPSSGSGGPSLSFRSPALPSNHQAQASDFEGQSTTFIKVRPQFPLFLQFAQR
jgi:hypothetical protein